jgi:hypothetical protein
LLIDASGFNGWEDMTDRSMRYTKLEFRDGQHSPRLRLLIG